MEFRTFTELPTFDISQNTIYTIDISNDEPDNIERFVNMSIDKNLIIRNENPVFIGFEYINRFKYSSLEDNQNGDLICITHLNDSSYPIYITNINKYKYMYKKFDLEEKVIINFPVSNTQIKLDCGVSVVSNDITELFAIYAFSKIPDSSMIYVSNRHNAKKHDFKYNIKKEHKNVQIENLFGFSFFNKILYERSNQHAEPIKKLYNYVPQQCSIFQLIEARKYNNSETFETHLRDRISGKPKKDNRFLQRSAFYSLIDKLLCDYLLKLLAEDIKNVTNDNPFILNIMKFIMDKEIMPKITNNYNIPIGQNIDAGFIGKRFLTNIDNNNREPLKDNTQDFQLLVDLMLTENSDYEGYSHEFDDGIKNKLKKGDLIIYWNDSTVNNNIYKGKIVLLTFGINIITKQTITKDDIYKQSLFNRTKVY
jgi:hypothetical protein